MKRLSALLIPIVLLSLLPTACNKPKQPIRSNGVTPTHYYVSPSGNDSNSGTSSSPFKTVQKGYDAASSGDIVHVRDGTYTPHVLTDQNNNRVVLWAKKSGTAEAPITIQADGNVVFDGLTTNRWLVYIDRADHITMSGFEFVRARRQAVVINHADHVLVKNCIAHDFNSDGHISGMFRIVGTSQFSGYENCAAFGSGDGSTSFCGFEMRENVSTTTAKYATPPQPGNIGYPNGLPESEWDDWPGYEIAPRYCFFRDCIAYNHYKNTDHSDAFGLRYTADCEVSGCVGYNAADDSYDLLSCTRTMTYNNIFFGQIGPGNSNGIKSAARGGLDNLFIRNIIFRTNDDNLDIEKCARCQAINNTLVDSGSRNIALGRPYGGHSGYILINNVIQYGVDNVGGDSAAKISTWDYNVMSGGNGRNIAGSGPHNQFNTLAEFTGYQKGWQPDTNFPNGLDARGKIAYIRNQVESVLSLVPGSPGHDQGVEVPGITDGFQGSAPDMGALELGGDVDPPVFQGACCVNDVCSVTTQENCTSQGGEYQGNNTVCAPNICDPIPDPTGACCVDTECVIVTLEQCAAGGGEYQGDGTLCSVVNCGGDPPAYDGKVIKMSLLDASDGNKIVVENLTANTEVVFDPNAGYTIEAFTDPATVGSMILDVSKDNVQLHEQNERNPAYLLFGNSGDNYTPWPVAGPELNTTYVVTATPFKTTDFKTPGSTTLVTFKFIEEIVPPVTGACCFQDGRCFESMLEADCLAGSNRYGGDNSTCATIDPPCEPPPPPTGACCDDEFGICSNGATQEQCESNGQRYGGNGSACETLDPPCEAPSCNKDALKLAACDAINAYFCSETEENYDDMLLALQEYHACQPE